MTSLTQDRRALVEAEAVGQDGAPADGATFLKIVQILQRKERLAASGAAFERFDPTAPGIHPARRREPAGALTFTG
jgi:hypothetical protein